MIFISHNSKDKAIVEPIAIRLSSIFGQEKVFYDSWSIQPGDGIIDRMNEGLSNCKVFLFFVSNNSLNSNMVKLEWQNAIMKMTNGQAKIIPVRLDNCMMPAILLQSLYIDLFQNGLEVAIRQIVDVSSGSNTFTPQFTEVSNLVAYKSWQNGTPYYGKLQIECTALYFMEPISNFIFATPNPSDDISFNCIGINMFNGGFIPNAFNLNLNQTINAIRVDFPRPITPSYPQIVEFSAKSNSPIDVLFVMHESERQKWSQIPLLNK